MTARAGGFYNVFPTRPPGEGALGLRGKNAGAFYAFNAVPSIFKNTGWYAAGSVYESWLSNSTPNATPPSGHTLTGIQYIQVR